MRFLTARALLATALFSLVVVIPALPPAKTGSRWFALEARIASAIEGTTRVYLLFSGFVFGAVPPAWIAQVPLLGKVWHVDNCFLCGLLVLGPVLAAFGFRAAVLRRPAREGRDDLIIAATLLLVIVGAWLGFRHAAHRQTYGPGTTISLLEYGQVIPVSAFVGKNLALMLLASVGLTHVAPSVGARWDPPEPLSRRFVSSSCSGGTARIIRGSDSSSSRRHGGRPRSGRRSMAGACPCCA